MQIKWSNQKVKLSELLPAKYNPRKLTEKQKADLHNSIQRFSLADPIIINKNKTIIGGHQRIKILKENGVDEVDVRIPDRDLTNEEEKELNLRLNRNLGEWDWELLGDFDKDMLFDVGFDSEELDKIFAIEPEEKDDEVPAVPEEAKSKLGDIYKLGNHRVMCGDSTSVDAVEKLMDRKNVNMVFTDPPYGLGGYGGRNKMRLKGDADKDIKKFYACIPLAKEMYIWGNYKNIYMLDRMPRDVIVWYKNNFGLGRGYRGQYELCFYYGEFKGSDSDVWKIDKDLNYKHPTQKPVELAVRAMLNSSIMNNIILDIYLGSGSTLIACEKTNRICYGMELDPKYVDVIVERWEKYTGQKAEKLNG